MCNRLGQVGLERLPGNSITLRVTLTEGIYADDHSAMRLNSDTLCSYVLLDIWLRLNIDMLRS